MFIGVTLSTYVVEVQFCSQAGYQGIFQKYCSELLISLFIDL